jgi:hypothetical protein
MSSQKEDGLGRENGPTTHDDDFASGGGTQDDPPCVRLRMLLETERTYTAQTRARENLSLKGND